ncbi:zinc carboxypeptidase [Salegentibacter salinarum]|uniref:Zinc carboxypeptidase n=1 Tax=Salegentibacter salinarum TaxID=447422 RepID=A0A2N0U0A4_9FLAO|nr:M14 family metallopeptidase [Salegentibacter salinarum]PKD20431.1 zinc carboxypeptidase [Salegentibacter salinarum]SKB84793.1 Zinc carboxypeptidase [Salegentibacter salinarum]
MQKLLPFLIFFIFVNSFAQQEDLSLDYYLPQDVSYNEEIPKPQDIIGYIPGEWHVTHDLLLNYMRELARVSPRISIENRGETYEGRPLILLTITSEENQNNLEEIRQNHLALTQENASSLDTEEMPIVVNQGFSIHGNEASGSNAALLAAYYLAAAEGEEIQELLDNTIILFDPAFNPDGLQRFSSWANIHKSENINPDPQDREYDEVWPGGRTNHYWFDMNRDWLPVQLPESQARLETFHKWSPNILTDHHEMGSNSSFFFQPGIPSRTHPLTPDINQDLTREIGTYHAAAFDELGSFYYTEENYDDFYYGKGSTFPDINGSIGILFEQGSSRGHAQETDNGVLTFPFTIRNQFTAALSTLEAAKNMREKILNYQRDFYKNARNSAENGAYVFGSEKDASSAYELAKILKKHKIDIHQIEEDFKTDGINFKKNSAYVVPKNQRQHRLVKAMFERRTEFEDSLFYDISAWTLPLAFNLDFAEDVKMNKAGQKIENLEKPEIETVEKSNYAYVMQWHDFYSPKALNMILEKGLRAKVGMQPFSLENKEYDYGTILIPVQNQELDKEEMHEFLQEVAQKSNVQIDGIGTGLTQGVNLGSNQFRALEPAKVALIVGEGITPYDAGEIWHLFDQRYDMKITKLDTRNFSRTDLSGYTDIILPNSWGSALDDGDIEKLKEWVRDGGTLIGYRNAARFFEREDFMDLEIKKDSLVAEDISFEEQRDFRGAQGIGGAIFEANIDRSHPVNFGYTNDKLPLFRNTTIFVEADKQSYNNPIQYTEEPLLSGYISAARLDSIAGTVPFKHTGMGRGNVILFTDNTNFRAFWFGTNKLLMNAIFFGEEM